jgi:OOP family OmpA-OmpF porin
MMNITRKIVKFASCLALIFGAVSVWAEGFKLILPNAIEEMYVQTADQDSYKAPIGPWSQGEVTSVQLNGRLIKRAWQVYETTSTVDQFAQPVLEQLKTAGYQIIFDCRDSECGGFDFRFATEVLPAPFIFVNLQDFRFVTLKFEQQYKTLLISRIANTLSFQLIEVIRGDGINVTTTHRIAQRKSSLLSNDIIGSINQNGRAVLRDLEYESGSSKLGKGPFKSLSIVAKFLTDTPNATALLVGHTDNVGSLESNILLSKQRASAVVERLGLAYGVDVTRLSAKGVGYLTPLISNSTENGRELNRRVEFILGKIR